MLAAEFVRPDGPRFSDHVTSPVDHEMEMYLRDRLVALFPARFVGEEAGVLAAEAADATNGYCWVVDPHDGTRAFLEGRRGSAVSVALLRGGIPVLGVVYAPLSPDRGPDMIAWAEGAPGITRNGALVPIDLRRRELTATDVVFLNHGVWQRPIWNGTAVAPGRFMPLPSIAYRLARVAVGDGLATVTLRPVNAHDVAAGHALLLAAGGVLTAEDGVPVTYDDQGQSRPSACFGGAPLVVEALRTRPWRGSTEARREPRVTLTWPRVTAEATVDRAVGCLLGLAAGDSLGSLVEGQTKDAIARRYPAGLRDMLDGGTYGTLAGQATDDTELALTLARGLVGRAEYDPNAARADYCRWLESNPFGCGPTTRAALNGRADPNSRSNGSLMRVAPIGIWAASPARAAATAMADSALTHPHPVCRTACAAFAAAIAAAVDGADPAAVLRVAMETARGSDPVAAALGNAASGRVPITFEADAGSALLSLHTAFYHLAAGTNLEAALIHTVGQGGDTDTNAAITGALLGAVQGRSAIPVRWAMPVLTCRPDAGRPDAGRPDAGFAGGHPRPDVYWCDDITDLAEALLSTARGNM